MIPKDAFIFLFVSDNYVFKKLEKHCTYKQIEIILLSSIYEKGMKNAMDFCIISKLSETIQLTKHQELIILSKDKDYDIPILYLSQNYPHRSIIRYSLTLIDYCQSNHQSRLILEKASPHKLQ